jgi:spore coat polysaccharide biosynthesis protein SpsF
MGRTMRAFVQARMSSARFPGKVLAPFRGVPIITHVVEAVRRALPEVPVAVLTSDEVSDDPLAAYLQSRNVTCFRGSRDDVLGRFGAALQVMPCGWVLRLCADSPLLNGPVLREVVARATDAATPDAPDLVTTIAPRTIPNGQNAELIPAGALQAMAADGSLTPADREHVTRAIHADPARHRIVNVSSGQPALADLSFVVDTVEDLRRLEALDDAAIDRCRHAAFWKDATGGETP